MKEKNSNKINKFLLVTTILSMTILLIGGTFSYFTLSTMSKMNALAVSAGKVRLGVGIRNRRNNRFSSKWIREPKLYGIR